MPDDFSAQATDGDETTADEIYRRYAERLLRFSERRIAQRLGRRFDAEDVVQSVFRTFFRRRGGGEYALDGWESLWQLLVQIAANKIRRHAKFHTAKRRDVRGEIYADEAESCGGLFAHMPGTDSADALLDTLDEALHGLNEQQTEIVCLTLQGFTASEIAYRIHLSRTTVWRVLQRVRTRLDERADGNLEK